jgi:UDP-N-acetyl-D-mannosaminuronate dehydrogenase
MSFETVSVIGLGYIGLPTAAMFASRKIKVISVDVNKHAVDTINRGEIHIVEPELDMLVQASVNQGYLKASLTAEPADAFLMTVPTPFIDDKDHASKLIHTARQVNDAKPDWVFDKIKMTLADFLTNSPKKTAKQTTIACLGLAFKPDIDDLRESPALAIVQEVSKWFNGELLVVEPNIKELPNSLINITTLVSVESAVKQADILVLLVNHKEFYLLKEVENLSLYVGTKGLLSK